MINRILARLRYEKQHPSPEIEKYVEHRKRGKVLLSLFLICMIVFKIFLSNQYLFLASLLLGIFGFPLYFGSFLIIFYIKAGLEIPKGLYDIDSLSKFIYIMLGFCILLAGFLIPITIKNL